MARFYFVGFLILMCFDTLSQFGFKFSAMHSAPVALEPAWFLRVVSQYWSYAALLGYLGAFFTWMTLLKHAPIGPAFAASHLEIVSVLICSYFFLGERLSWLQLAGGALILGGIVLLGFAEAEIEKAKEKLAAIPKHTPQTSGCGDKR